MAETDPGIDSQSQADRGEIKASAYRAALEELAARKRVAAGVAPDADTKVEVKDEERREIRTILRQSVPDRDPGPPNELEAQQQRAGRLRRSPHIRAALDVARFVPAIKDQIQLIVDRRSEFLAAADPGERHRTLAPLLAGIHLDDRAAALWDIAMDRTAAGETDHYKDKIDDGQTYAPIMFAGTGPHSQIIGAELQVLRPDVTSLSIDERDRHGGQFGAARGASGKMNSRTRPEQRHGAHRPGTDQSLNSLGVGVMQQADLTRQSYGDRHDLGRAVRTNEVMVTELMLDTELVGIRRNTGVSEANPGAIVSVEENEAGDRVELSHDALVVTGGIGTALTGFERDDGTVPNRTRRILDAEARKPLGERRVLLAEEFITRMSDPTSPFPLRGLKRVAVVGAGDSGRWTVHELLGYGTDNGKSVQTLDRVQEVGWYGQKSLTKETLAPKERILYAQAALEMPREGPEYAHRVTPIPQRAQRLEYAKDDDDEPTGQLLLVSGEGNGLNEREEPWDLIVINAGFRDRTAQVLGMLQPETLTNSDDIKARLPNAVVPGARFTIDAGESPGLGSGTIEILDVGDDDLQTVRYIQTFDSDRDIPDASRVAKSTFNAFLRTSPAGTISRLELPATTLKTEYVLAEGRTSPGPEVVLGLRALEERIDEFFAPGVKVAARFGTYTVISYDREADLVRYSFEPDEDQGISGFEGDLSADDWRERVTNIGVTAEIPPKRKDIDLLETEPIAIKYVGVPVFRAGPNAKLPVTEREKEVIPVLDKIGENSDAIFRYVERDEALARLLADLIPPDVNNPNSLFAEPYAPRPESLPPPESILPANSYALVRLNRQVAEQPLPVGANWDDLVKYMAAEFSQTHKLPPEVSDLSFRIERIADASVNAREEPAFQLTTRDEELTRDPSYRDALTAMARDPLMQQVLIRLAEPQATRPVGGVEVNLPVRDGRIDLERVSAVSAPRRPDARAA